MTMTMGRPSSLCAAVSWIVCGKVVCWEVLIHIPRDSKTL
jgi:hypothetical protein